MHHTRWLQPPILGDEGLDCVYIVLTASGLACEQSYSFGATVRYVTLPHEAHGYAAAESNKHVIAEMLNFLDKYVKNVGPRPQ